jgi:(2Fe-2S) ferredoxin
MPEFKKHILVCDVVRDDGIHCGNKGGIEIKKKFVEALSEKSLRSEVYVSSVGCTSQHGLCEMSEGSVIVYDADNKGTWYIVGPDDVDTIVEEHIIDGNTVKLLVNEKMKVNLGE